MFLLHAGRKNATASAKTTATTSNNNWTKLVGINWADARDNFVDGWIIPSGIDHSGAPEEVSRQADQILSEFQRLLFSGDNDTNHTTNNPHDNYAFTIRLGINPATVLNDDWWPRYQDIIDRAVHDHGYSVILACWEEASHRNGRIDNPDEFWKMWDKVVQIFAGKDRVLFEIFNEPHGCADEQWRNWAARWVDRHTEHPPHTAVNATRTPGPDEETIPILSDKQRILVSGTGYSEHVTTIAKDKRLDGCRLSFHLYSWFGKHTRVESWKDELDRRVGIEHAPRTSVTEWGAPMKIRPNHYYCSTSSNNQSSYGDDGDKDGHESALAMSEVIRDWKMGSIYWPGLRDGDVYSLTERKDTAKNTTDTRHLWVTNQSGKARLQWSFGFYNSAVSSPGMQEKGNDQANKTCKM